MTRYTYIVEPYGFEVKVEAETEKAAYKKAYASLTESQKDGTSILDCVNIESRVVHVNGASTQEQSA